MDLQRLTIGQMAELNHVSEQALRLYDREGLGSRSTPTPPPATATITSRSRQSSTSYRT